MSSSMELKELRGIRWARVEKLSADISRNGNRSAEEEKPVEEVNSREEEEGELFESVCVGSLNAEEFLFDIEQKGAEEV